MSNQKKSTKNRAAKNSSGFLILNVAKARRALSIVNEAQRWSAIQGDTEDILYAAEIIRNAINLTLH